MDVLQQIDLPPVGAVRFVIEVLVEVGGRLLEPVNPVPHRQVAVPGVSQGTGKIVGLQDILVHLCQQVVTTRPFQGVAPFVDGVGHRPAPLHSASGVVNPTLVKVGRRRHRDHGPEVRRRRTAGGQGILGGPQVGLAGSADSAVGPRLAGRPLHGVVAVLVLLEQRVVGVSLRVEPGPAVLADHHVSSLGKKPGGVFLVVGVGVFTVGPAGYQHWKAARSVRPVHICRQTNAVAHGRHDVAFTDDFVFR